VYAQNLGVVVAGSTTDCYISGSVNAIFDGNPFGGVLDIALV
jgi:hypothetical protein